VNLLRTAAIAAISLANSAVAQSYLWECDVPSLERNLGWISPKIVAVIRPEGQVEIIDAILLGLEQSPAIARVSRHTDSRLNVNWQVRRAKDAGNKTIPTLNYSFRLNKTTARISVFASADGFSSRFSATGTCIQKTE